MDADTTQNGGYDIVSWRCIVSFNGEIGLGNGLTPEAAETAARVAAVEDWIRKYSAQIT